MSERLSCTYSSMHAGAAQCLTASAVSLSEDKQRERRVSSASFFQRAC